MVSSELKAISHLDIEGERIEQLVRYLHDVSTSLTDEVLVKIVGQVVDGATMS